VIAESLLGFALSRLGNWLWRGPNVRLAQPVRRRQLFVGRLRAAPALRRASFAKDVERFSHAAHFLRGGQRVASVVVNLQGVVAKLEQVTTRVGHRARVAFDEVQVLGGDFPNNGRAAREDRRIVEIAFGGHNAVHAQLRNAPIGKVTILVYGSFSICDLKPRKCSATFLSHTNEGRKSVFFNLKGNKTESKNLK